MDGDYPRALILRGPPGAGKSPIAELLSAQPKGSSKYVVLDDGWCMGEHRFSGPDRYADLRCEADVIIIELGWGEPHPAVFTGATLNPSEWIAELESEGRRLSFFLLWCDLIRARQRKYGRIDVRHLAADHHRYDEGQPASSSSFHARLGGRFNERLIDTSNQSTEVSAGQIRAAAEI